MTPTASPPASHSVAAELSTFRDRLATTLLGAGARLRRDPHAALELRAPALVFAPHPDDEVLGCGGMIALKAQAGGSVHVVIMTDGRTSHRQFIDAATLIRMRHDEALEASRSLGLEPDSYTFLDFEDNRLRANAIQAQARVAELLERHSPQQVFVPHRRDRLPDHVATYDVVTAAIRERGATVTLLEYPVWLWNTWPWTAARPSLRRALSDVPRSLRDGIELAFGCNTRVDISSVTQRKLAALAHYRSQVERQLGNPQWPILADVSGGSFLARFHADVEVFRRTEGRVK